MAFIYGLYDRKADIRIVDNATDTSALAIYMFFSKLDEIQRLGTAIALPSDQTTNPNTEDKKMRTDGQTIRGNEMDMGKVKAWAKRTFSRERMAEAGLVVATLVVTGYLGSVLVKGIETYSMSGF